MRASVYRGPPVEVGSVSNRELYRVMLEIEAFPGMPATAAKLLPLLDNSDSTASEIESILKYDPEAMARQTSAGLKKMSNFWG